MSVKKGYRQTEVGLIPDEWEVDFLERFWSVTDCKHITAKFTADGYPIVSIKEVQNRFVDLVNANRTSARFFNLLAEGTRRPRSGDLILSRNATVGEIAQVADWHPPFAMGQDVCLLRKRSPKYSSAFLQSLFKSPIISRQLSDLMVGSTFKRANVQQIKHLQVAMPNPAEQEAIAGALSDADAWIESLEQLLAKKRQIKQGAMQELLAGKRRLPGFSGEWVAKRLGDLGSTYGGLAGKTKSDFGAGDAFYVTFMNVMSNVVIDCTTFERVNVVASESQNRVLKNDILFNGSSETPEEVAMCAFVDTEVKDVYLNSFCFGFRLRDDSAVDGRFLAYYLRSNVGREMMKSLAQGSTRYNLSKTALLKAVLQLPCATEQTAIATLLSDMDTEIESLKSKLAKVRRIKQGMMQELLTGRIRLV